MSFQFSSDHSNLYSKSNYSSESSLKSYSKTLGLTGATILNNSYPMNNQKKEFQKENETYANLVALKNLNISANNIKHIQYHRNLDYGEVSFMNRENKLSKKESKPLIYEFKQKNKEEIKENPYFLKPALSLDNIYQCKIDFTLSGSKIIN